MVVLIHQSISAEKYSVETVASHFNNRYMYIIHFIFMLAAETFSKGSSFSKPFRDISVANVHVISYYSSSIYFGTRKTELDFYFNVRADYR